MSDRVLGIAATRLELRDCNIGVGVEAFSIYGLSDDQDRGHFAYSRDNLRQIGEWLITFATGEPPKPKPVSTAKLSDPMTWEIKVSGPES